MQRENKFRKIAMLVLHSVVLAIIGITLVSCVFEKKELRMTIVDTYLIGSEETVYLLSTGFSEEKLNEVEYCFDSMAVEPSIINNVFSAKKIGVVKVTAKIDDVVSIEFVVNCVLDNDKKQ